MACDSVTNTSKRSGPRSSDITIGIDAGICVLLALDLLLTWMRIPFPLLRQTAWLLTAATIAFNGAASWPDPLGVGMHSVIPILFVVSVEAARHAVGRIADITADKHMEGVRLTRWLLSPLPTFKLWRRMKLWELRSYEQVIKLEQDRLIYQSRLQARFGRSWKRKAPVEALMPLRLAKYGIPIADTAAAGLAAAGIEPMLLPPAPVTVTANAPALPAARREGESAGADAPGPIADDQVQGHPDPQNETVAEAQDRPRANLEKQAPEAAAEADIPAPAEQPQEHPSPWFAAPVGHAQSPVPAAQDDQVSYGPEQSPDRQYPDGQYQDAQYPDGQYQDQHDERFPQGADVDAHPVMVPSGPGRSRPLGGYHPDYDAEFVLDDDAYYDAFRKCAGANGAFPTPLQFGSYLDDLYGQQLPGEELETYTKRYEERFQLELDEHIA